MEDVEGMEVGGLKVPDDELLQPGEDPAGGGEVVLDKDGEQILTNCWCDGCTSTWLLWVVISSRFKGITKLAQSSDFFIFLRSSQR